MSATISALCLTVAATVTGLGSGYGARVLVRRTAAATPRWFTVALLVAGVAAAGAVTWRFADRPSQYPAYLLLAALSLPLAAVDAAEHRIPDAIVKPGFLLAVALLGADALHTHQTGPLFRAVLAAVAVTVTAVLLIVGTEESMGWGDGKLLAFSALFLGYLGWGRVLEGFLLSFTGAALVAGGLSLIRRRGARLPLAPYLLLGTLIAVVARR